MSNQIQEDILFDGLIDSATAYAFVKEMDAIPSIEELDQQCESTPDLDKEIKKIIDKNLRQSKFRKSAHIKL